MKYLKLLSVVFIAVSSLALTIAPAAFDTTNQNLVVYSPMSNAFVVEPINVVN